MKEWVLFSAWTLGLSSLCLFPHTCWPVPWPPGWDGVLYTFREAAGGSHSLPFFSLPLSLSPSPRQTRAVQSRCGHTVVWNHKPCAPLLPMLAIFTLEKRLSGKVCLSSELCCVLMPRFSLPSWPVTRKKERQPGGRERMWIGCERHLLACCKKKKPKHWPVGQTLSSTAL